MPMKGFHCEPFEYILSNGKQYWKGFWKSIFGSVFRNGRDIGKCV